MVKRQRSEVKSSRASQDKPGVQLGFTIQIQIYPSSILFYLVKVSFLFLFLFSCHNLHLGWDFLRAGQRRILA